MKFVRILMFSAFCTNCFGSLTKVLKRQGIDKDVKRIGSKVNMHHIDITLW